MPASRAAQTTARVWAASQREPKLLPPRPTTETVRPDRPSWRYLMAACLSARGCWGARSYAQDRMAAALPWTREPGGRLDQSVPVRARCGGGRRQAGTEHLDIFGPNSEK